MFRALSIYIYCRITFRVTEWPLVHRHDCHNYFCHRQLVVITEPKLAVEKRGSIVSRIYLEALVRCCLLYTARQIGGLDSYAITEVTSHVLFVSL